MNRLINCTISSLLVPLSKGIFVTILIIPISVPAPQFSLYPHPKSAAKYIQLNVYPGILYTSLVLLRETHLSNLQFELFPLIADVPHRDIDDGQPRGLHVPHADHRLCPLGRLVLAFVDRDLVAELAPVPDLEIVPRHQRHRPPVIISARVVVPDRVRAVVRDVLARPRGEHLQECDLVGVGLVREVEAKVGNVREPHLPLARLHCGDI